MYTPKYFEEANIEVLHELIRTHPLATLVTMSSHGLNANHIPMYLVQDTSEYGILRGHVARANPVWRDLVNEVEALAIFQGADTYISPSWYSTKQEDGKVVPTWDYVTVHAYGPLRVVDDVVWLRELLENLTTQHEAPLSEPWSIADAPREYIDKMMTAIVGIEIVIRKIHGKWKVSQNQPEQNQESIVVGLQEQNTGATVAMAQLVEQAGKK